MDEDAALLRLMGVEKRYGELSVLNGVDLTVKAGEFVAITGPSGSGKSTLLGILGLLEAFEAGEYTILGRQANRLREKEASRLRNQMFGFVFQMFHLLPDLSAWENVARPLLYAGVRPKKRRERAMELLDRFGLKERAYHRPTQLSGGEQQRVAIARALANNPEVILADEPTGNLPQAQWEPVLKTLQELNRVGKTVVLVTHDPFVAGLAQRGVELGDGKVSPNDCQPLRSKAMT